MKHNIGSVKKEGVVASGLEVEPKGGHSEWSVTLVTSRRRDGIPPATRGGKKDMGERNNNNNNNNVRSVLHYHATVPPAVYTSFQRTADGGTNQQTYQ